MRFEEEKHPRDSDGKFAEKGGSDREKIKDSVRKYSSDPNRDLTAIGLSNPKPQRLAVNTPEAKQLYEQISRGDYLTEEEIQNHPAVKEMDRLSEEYKNKFGDTSLINTPERQLMRKQWEREFLDQGSMRITGYKNDRPIYETGGEVKREFKAVIAIGLPASGKSTRIANPVSAEIGAFVFDSDEIKKRIPEYRQTNGGAADSVHKESKNLQKSAFEKFLSGERNGDNLVIPTIGSDIDNLQKNYIAKLEQSGYDVEIRYQDASPTESMNRVIMRAIETGRIIPSREVLKYGNKPKEVFEELKKRKNRKGEDDVR